MSKRMIIYWIVVVIFKYAVFLFFLLISLYVIVSGVFFCMAAKSDSECNNSCTERGFEIFLLKE